MREVRVLGQAGRLNGAGSIPAEAAWARLGHLGYGPPGPGGWLVAARQTHAEDWRITAQYGATTDAPGGLIPERTGSGARGQAGWADGIT